MLDWMSPPNEPNYYEILHVQPDAPLEIVKASYRTLMSKLDMHPDKGGDVAMAALINRAYAVLSDSASRALYDDSLRRQQETADVDSPPATEPAAATSRQDYTHLTTEYCVFCMKPHEHGPDAPPDARCADCRSPLTHSLSVDSMPSGRREMPRVSADEPLHFFTDWPQSQPRQGLIKDLSLNGIQFSCRQRLSAQDIVKLSCATLEAVARITYCRRGPDYFGFVAGGEFITVELHKDRGAFVSVKT